MKYTKDTMSKYKNNSSNIFNNTYIDVSNLHPNENLSISSGCEINTEFLQKYVHCPKYEVDLMAWINKFITSKCYCLVLANADFSFVI